MTREEIKTFWLERAKVKDVPRSESLVNFLSDAQIADLYIKTEIALIEDKFKLKSNDVVADIGAGNGRFSLLFAPKVKKVIAVEFISDFAASIEQQAKKMQFENIEVLNMPAEEFCRENYASVVFVSGLLNNLDSEQYHRTLENIQKTLQHGGVLFLRETISVLDDEFIVDKFSEELGTHYCSKYRTSRQHIEAFTEYGFKLVEYSPFFEDGSILNKRLETRLYYFIFLKS